jgi:hypothetical protein
VKVEETKAFRVVIEVGSARVGQAFQPDAGKESAWKQ